MRLFTFNIILILLTTTSNCVSLDLSFEYEDETIPSYVSRRAIDGTRGRKYFDPQTDGFFDNYGSDKGRYQGSNEKSDFTDLRSNVPGEPGIDYPAYLAIPKTSFTCTGRNRGYYADVAAGCQVFHVCDETLVSSFLCPIGSLFSQRLLTCDWWIKVPCSESQEYYNLQSHADDFSLIGNDMLRQTFMEMTNYENLPLLADQEEQNNKAVPVFMNVRRNENQLQQGNQFRRRDQVRGHYRNRFYEGEKSTSTTTEEPKESLTTRVKPLDEGNRRPSARGYISFRTSGNISQGHPRRPTYEASSTEQSVTVKVLNSEETYRSPVPHKENNRERGTTVVPYETSSQEYQDYTNVNVFTDTPSLKKELEGGVNETMNLAELSNHNSANEYDDMEVKDSIGLAKSKVERKLEKKEEESTESEKSKEQKIILITLEPFENTTPVILEKIEFTTQQSENIDIKESISLDHSKVKEKTQLYDNKTLTTPEYFYNITQQATVTSVNSNEEKLTFSTQKYEIENSTQSYSSAESSAEIVTTDVDLDLTFIETTPTPILQDAHKMSGFLINVVEKKPTNSSIAAMKIYLEDQKKLNTSEISTTTNLPATVQDSEEQITLIINNVKNISDINTKNYTILEVSLSLNDSSTLKKEDRTPISTDILAQVIAQHENHPIDKSNLETIKSDQMNSETSISQDQYHADSIHGVRTYQNFRTYQNQQNDPLNYRNHKLHTLMSTTFGSYQSVNKQPVDSFPTTSIPYRNYENDPNVLKTLKNYQDFEKESINFKNHKFLASTLQTPLENSRNQTYQNNERDSNIYQINSGRFNIFGSPKVKNFVPTVVKQEENNNFRNYQNQAHGSIEQQNEDDRNDLQNYRVNDQAHFTDKNVQNQNQYQNYDTYKGQNYDSYENTENSKNHKNQQYMQNLKNHHDQLNVNYSYLDEDDAAHLVENTSFGQYGARISAKNTKINSLNLNNKPNKNIIEDPDAHLINSGLQGKTANFLRAMGQLIKNDRLPRPFTHNKYESNENTNRQNYANNNNNGFNVQNKNKDLTVPNFDYSSNLNGNLEQNFTNVQHSINLDELAAPELNDFNQNIKSKQKNLNSNQSNESTQPNFSNTKRERILNYNTVSSTPENFVRISENPIQVPESPIQIPVNPVRIHESPVGVPQSPIYTPYTVQSTPDINGFPFNGNEQVVPILQPNLNQYNTENSQIPLSQPLYYNYRQSSLSNVENYPIPNRYFDLPKDIQPPVDYYFERTTEASNENDYNTNVNVPFLGNTQTHSFKYDRPQNDEQIVKNARISNENFQTVKNTQPVAYSSEQASGSFENAEKPDTDSQIQTQTHLQSSDFNFRPTPLPNIETENQSNLSDNQRYNNINNFNVTKMLTMTKTTVETEFIPSLSFDFGSDEGRKGYLEALEKGLVPNEGLRRLDDNVNTSASGKVEKEEDVSRTSKSDKSELMDNFKDTGEVMSEAE